jgi:hypothetical protein
MSIVIRPTKTIQKLSFAIFSFIIITFLLGTMAESALAQIPRDKRFFSETNHSVEGQFLYYWESNGELFRFGYPLTDAYLTTNGRLTQVFERAIFEWWPENPPEYRIQLALLGNLLAGNSRRTNPAAFIPISNGVSNGVRDYFNETGHYLNEPFRTYWKDNGGLPTYGFPICEEFKEASVTDGNIYLTQYFERNRFEYHPENFDTEFEILLGLLGSEYAQSHSQDFPLKETPAVSAWDQLATGAKGIYPPVPTGLSELPPALPPSSSPIKVSGSGTNASNKFQLAKGPAMVKIESDTPEFFEAMMISNSGEESYLVSTEGVYSGTVYVYAVESGSYAINVTSKGNWSFEVTDFKILRNLDASLLPVASLTGKGDTALPKLSMSQGLKLFTFTHDGESDFSAFMLNEEGEEIEVFLANGNISGSKATSAPVTGTYYLSVKATGNWSITIQNI